MKKFLKIFLSVIVIIGLFTISGFAIFKNVYVPTHEREADEAIEDIIVVLPEDEDETQEEDLVEEEIILKTEDELWVEAIESSDRVNVLLFGTDGYRADTQIFLSYSKSEDDVTMVTIPRDTKHYVEGMDAQGQDKINAVFCFPNGKGGADAQRAAVEELLGVPIHYYVKVNYYGLEAIVNTIGGVEVFVHRDMDYDDIYAEPPLHIDLKEGTQVLDGDKAMQYIRWRKNNDGSGDSDLERTKRQQEFIIKVVKKSIGLNIAKVIDICFDYVRTDMSKEDLLYFGSEMIGFDLSSIKKMTLPGEADMRYFYHDIEATKLLMQELYGFK
jgi:LCP family protein required for cell wall assembly